MFPGHALRIPTKEHGRSSYFRITEMVLEMTNFEIHIYFAAIKIRAVLLVGSRMFVFRCRSQGAGYRKPGHLIPEVISSI